MSVLIYQPGKNPMQSGVANCKKWFLIHKSDQDTKFIDPLMGWVGNNNTENQVKLSFEDVEDAINYAKRSNLEYDIVFRKQRKVKPKSYSDNFK